ncbi:hypothetical protein Sta7437_1907 [Stanieria cyanosphaera PCC 7437]|uniref:Uncharacterized protein n=1 Tax=Stanieria cyanosphaera (strain ATCC 29371 / PCC 7437) TaxID=111780 RepID=K9XSE7_STAC7|nr:hypothetical protein [Stanieria cyanosphaera]AFZ35463.1 hypothetical protein Sta7437_1907 [Stanieria cyanosphaera PCC 7437]
MQISTQPSLKNFSWLSFTSKTLSLAIAFASFPVWASESLPSTKLEMFSTPIFVSSMTVEDIEVITQESPLSFSTEAFLQLDELSEVKSDLSQPFLSAKKASTINNPSDNRWQFSVEPYLFVPFDVEADITVRGRSAFVEAGFSDIFNLDRIFATSLRLEAQKNRLGFIIDGSYLSIGKDGNLDITIPAAFLQAYGINTDVNVNAEVSLDARQGVLDLAVFYRVVDEYLGKNDTTSNSYPHLVVDPILGLRMNWLGQDTQINAINIGGIDIPNQDVELSTFFVEPMIGTQIGLELSERWAVGFRGDISGFDINADQNLAWKLLIGGQYRFSRLTALQFAYQFNKFEYLDGTGTERLGLDLQQQGLWLGLQFRF